VCVCACVGACTCGKVVHTVYNIAAMLCDRCRSLVYVSFCYCEHITDAGVELMGHMPSLISLDLTGCCLTDQVCHNTSTCTHTK